MMIRNHTAPLTLQHARQVGHKEVRPHSSRLGERPAWARKGKHEPREELHGTSHVAACHTGSPDSVLVGVQRRHFCAENRTHGREQPEQ